MESRTVEINVTEQKIKWSYFKCVYIYIYIYIYADNFSLDKYDD